MRDSVFRICDVKFLGAPCLDRNLVSTMISTVICCCRLYVLTLNNTAWVESHSFYKDPTFFVSFAMAF